MSLWDCLVIRSSGVWAVWCEAPLGKIRYDKALVLASDIEIRDRHLFYFPACERVWLCVERLARLQCPSALTK